MQPSYYITIPKACRHIGMSFRLLLGLTLAVHPTAAHAISQDGLVGMASVQAVLIAVANLNRAMRSAAESPHDDWRRTDVQNAMRALPPAIILLAMDFKAGKLHDQDYPMVQAMLGGFVDVSAAEGYKKFLKAPSANLIPSLGSGFPQKFIGGSGGGGPTGAPGGARITFDDNAAKAKSASFADSTQAETAAPSLKTAALKSVGEREAATADSLRITFDDSAKKGGNAPTFASGTSTASSGSASTASARSGGMTATNAPLAGPASSSIINRLDAAFGGGEMKIIRKEGEDESVLDADFFEKTEGRRKGRRSKNQDFEIRKRPKYWQIAPLVRFAERLLLTEAHAECQGDCGAGGQGGGGGGGGGQAGQILFGIAAIMSAVMPAMAQMQAAKEQARAEMAVARENAAAQVKMTQITSDTSKFLSNQSTKIALQQTATTERMNLENQRRVSERLDKQLVELRDARDKQLAYTKEREERTFKAEQELNKERIALAKQQAEDNLKLAKQTLDTELTRAGLQGGFTNGQNSGSRLAVTQLNAAGGSVASAAGTSSSGSPSLSLGGAEGDPSLGQAFTSQDSSSNLARGALGNGSSVASSGGAQGLGALLASQRTEVGGAGLGGRGIAAAVPPTTAERLQSLNGGAGTGSTTSAASGSNRLLSSLSPAKNAAGETMSFDAMRGMFAPKVGASEALAGVSKSGTRAMTGARAAADPRKLAAVMNGLTHRMIRGSTRTDRIEIPRVAANSATSGETPASSDLQNFLSRSSPDFAEFQRMGGARAEEEEPPSRIHRTTGTGHSEDRGRGAYNPPTDIGEGAGHTSQN